MPRDDEYDPTKDERSDLDPIRRLNKDLRLAAETLTDRQARYLVDAYYQIQEWRKAVALQVTSADKAEEPHILMSWLLDNAKLYEEGIKSSLDAYSKNRITSVWSRSIVGIGPVISAGLIAHIDSDIHNQPTVGHLWAFAGLDPSKSWTKGQKRPWNAKLKTLTWKIGQSFMKFQNNPNDVYGKLYRERKALEIERNERLEFREQAVAVLRDKNIGKDTEAFKHYSVGKLPPGHIDARARRWAVKQFLADYWTVVYFVHFGTFPPLPYAISVLGHNDYRGLPNAGIIPGLMDEIERVKMDLLTRPHNQEA